MAKPAAKQLSLPDRNFTCTDCGRCCRDWYVAILPEELERLKALPWMGDGPAAGLSVRIGDGTYLAHRTDHTCIYFDREQQHCRIHAQFGAEAKPIGCRIYPYTISPTFASEFSVMPRFDCPAIRESTGRPISRDMGMIRLYVEALQLSGGYDRHDLGALRADVARRIVNGIFNSIVADNKLAPAIRMKGAMIAVNRFEELGSDFLNDIELDKILPSFFERVIDDAAALRPKRFMSGFERWRFLYLLAGYLCRDEEVVGGPLSARMARSLAMGRIIFGGGNARHLGRDNPDWKMSNRRLFDDEITNVDTVDLTLYWDMLKLRLQSYQFFGSSVFNFGFHFGLKNLFLTFPLVVEAARWSAASRDDEDLTITAKDIDFAVTSIDHSFGRSRFLRMGLITILTRQMSEIDSYAKLIHSIFH